MRRLALFFFFFPLIFENLTAQNFPPKCASGPYPHSNTCAGACVFCGSLEGFTSSTAMVGQGQIIPGFCTMIVHSMKYVAFIAGSTNLSINVTVGACTLGNGIEMGIYELPNCTNPMLVSNCNTQMDMGQTYPFTATGLHPGCVYYLVFDNNGPAACQFTVHITSGQTGSPPLPKPPTPIGPTEICPNGTATYSIPAQPFGCVYEWTAPSGATINGLPSPARFDHDNGTSVSIKFGNQGGLVCVKAQNACETSPISCLPVTIKSIPNTILPPATICFGDLFDWFDGNSYSTTQLLSHTFHTAQGCDSTVKKQLNVLPQNLKQLPPQPFCEGSCITVAGLTVCKSGVYEAILQAANGCDSIIRFTAVPILLNAQIAAPTDTLDCQTTSILLDGHGSVGENWRWFGPPLGSILLGSDSTQAANSAGLFKLVLEKTAMGKICHDTAQVVVNQQLTPPNASFTGLDTLTCFAPQSSFEGHSTTPNATFKWLQDGFPVSQTAFFNSGMAGQFVLLVTDPASGCTATDTLNLVDKRLEPNLSTKTDTLTCLKTIGQLSASTTTPAVSFQWLDNQQVISTAASIFPQKMGAFVVVATDSMFGCTARDTVFLLENHTPPDLSILNDTLTCLQPIGQLLASSQTSGATFQWLDNQGVTSSGPSFSTSADGQIIVVATNPTNGCTTLKTIFLEKNNTPPQAFAQGDALTCASPTAQLLGGSSLPDCAFFWTGAGGWSSVLPSPQVDFPGQFTLVVTAPNGCTASATAEILPNQTPVDLTALGATLTCSQPTASLFAASQMQGATFQWLDNQGVTFSQSNSPTISTAGFFTVIATSSSGCSVAATVEVVENNTPPSLAASDQILTCKNPTAQLLATSQTSGATFQWLDNQQVISNLATLSVSKIGNFEIVATDPTNGCTASKTVVVSENNTPPSLAASDAILTCANPTAQLLATSQTGGAMFQWLENQQVISILATLDISKTGNFELIATDPTNGCTASKTVVVSENKTPPSLAASDQILTCKNPTAQLLATSQTGGAMFQWLENQQVISILATLDVSKISYFELIATDPTNGCTASKTVSVSANKTPPSLAVSDAILTCTNPTTQLLATSQTNGAMFQWLENQQVISNLATLDVSKIGNFEIVATEPTNGCTASKIVSVSENKTPPDLTTSGGELDCSTGQLELLAASQTSDATFQWLDNQGVIAVGPSFLAKKSGDFTCLVTDPANGCTTSKTVSVFENQNAPQASATGDTLTCAEPTGHVFGSSTTAGATFFWTGPNGFQSNEASPMVAFGGVFELTVFGLNGCKSTSYVTVSTDKMPPNLSAPPNPTLTCAYPTAQLLATSQTSGAMFQWLENQQVISNLATLDVSKMGNFEIVATDPTNGCTTSKTVVVSENKTPPSLAASDAILTCANPTAQLLATSQTSGTTFQWLENQQVISNSTTLDISKTGIFESVATDPTNGCTASKIVSVSENKTPPSLAASGVILTCTNPTAQLLATSQTSGTTFQWLENQQVISILATLDVSKMGSFELIATDPTNGCTASKTVVVEDKKSQITAVALDLNLPICFEASGVELSVASVEGGLPPMRYSLDNQPLSSQNGWMNLPSGDHFLKIEESGGCSFDTILNLPAPLDWTISLGPDTTIFVGESLVLTAKTEPPSLFLKQIAWLPKLQSCDTCRSRLVAPKHDRWFEIVATDAFGCARTDSILVRVVAPEIYVPNVFSPNGDGENDRWQVFCGAGVEKIRRLAVFTRWGELVHFERNLEPNDPKHGWNGQYRGVPVPDGVYVWFVQIELAGGQTRRLKGDVTVVK